MWFRKARRVSLDEQLATLAEFDIRPETGALDEVRRVVEGDVLETRPYEALLEELGYEFDAYEHPRARRVWMLDFECIEDHGDYARVLRRLETLTEGALGISEVTDHVEIDDGEVHLRFRTPLGEETWEPVVNDDWLDPAVLQQYAERLRERNAGVGVYLGAKDYGQSSLLLSMKPRRVKEFTKRTGIRLRAL